MALSIWKCEQRTNKDDRRSRSRKKRDQLSMRSSIWLRPWHVGWKRTIQSAPRPWLIVSNAETAKLEDLRADEYVLIANVSCSLLELGSTIDLDDGDNEFYHFP